ncbi:MAG: ATP-grasp domain-containing protein [Dehalococcoidia bacterium]|jgi:biotin carboxylase|nr:MAG: Biotin carboxylase [Chloroflexota bacterium]|tara:strand:+ start:17486 stop:18709 length:1224 start_codon:yes stop_codon:yes gene_type:complete
MKRILLLLPGNTYRANDFIVAALKIKINIVIGTDQTQALSQKLPDRYLMLDFHKLKLSTTKIYNFSIQKKIDKILAVDDQGVLLASLASKKLNINHSSFESVSATKNKYILNILLFRNNLIDSNFFLINNNKNQKNKIKYPSVIKPLGLSSSRGVIRVNNKIEFIKNKNFLFNLLQNELKNECNNAFEKENILIQNYMPGKEYAVEGIVEQKRFKLLAVFQKPKPLTGPYFEETIYLSMPLCTSHFINQIIQTSQKTIEAIGINEGPVHIEYRVNKTGIYPIDVGARSIGGLCARIIQFENNITLEEIILNNALGNKFSAKNKQTLTAVMMIPTIHEGTIESISGIDEAKKIKNITDIQITVHKNQKIQKLPKANIYIGFIFAEGKSKKGIIKSLQKANAQIKITLS